MQNALVKRFVARGESLTELPLDVEKDDVESWESYWRAELAASGIADAGDSVRFIQWLHARSNPVTAAAKGASGTLLKVLEALAAHGVVVPSTAVSGISAALSAGIAGD